MKNNEYEEEKEKKKKTFSYGKPCIPLSATETSCSLVVNRGNDGVKFQSPGVQSCKNIHCRIQVDFAVVMDMQQRETGQPLLPHCCSHVVVEPTQCACTSLTLTRGHRNCASQLQEDADVRKHISVAHFYGFCGRCWQFVDWLIPEPPLPSAELCCEKLGGRQILSVLLQGFVQINFRGAAH